jgi:hypothetical protein
VNASNLIQILLPSSSIPSSLLWIGPSAPTWCSTNGLRFAFTGKATLVRSAMSGSSVCVRELIMQGFLPSWYARDLPGSLDLQMPALLSTGRLKVVAV